MKRAAAVVASSGSRKPERGPLSRCSRGSPEGPWHPLIKYTSHLPRPAGRSSGNRTPDGVQLGWEGRGARGGLRTGSSNVKVTTSFDERQLKVTATQLIHGGKSQKEQQRTLFFSPADSRDPTLKPQEVQIILTLMNKRRENSPFSAANLFVGRQTDQQSGIR